MGETVEFPSNGSTADGYLALPERAGPGVVVIQEWWGLVPHIKDVADRFAAEGFVALAPDLYHGGATEAMEPDEATKLLMAMELDRAARDMKGAVAFLEGHSMVEPKKVGCVGFCIGGALALRLAEVAPAGAAVAYYPYYQGTIESAPPAEAISIPVLFHFAEHDDSTRPGEELAEQLRREGREVEIHRYPGTTHAFFNDDRPEVHEPRAAAESWTRTIEFLRTHLK